MKKKNNTSNSILNVLARKIIKKICDLTGRRDACATNASTVSGYATEYVTVKYFMKVCLNSKYFFNQLSKNFIT